jgi:outer membrane protein TolC
MKNIGVAAVGGLLLLGVNCFAEETLPLDDYLQQVESANQEIKALNLSMEALGEKVLELDMVYSPYLTGNYAFIDDRSGAGFGSTLPVDRTRANSLSIGASKKFLTGTNVSVGYSYSDASISLLSPTTIVGNTALSSFTGYELRPTLQLSQSLLRDFNSGLTQSGIEKTKASARAAQYQQLFRKQQILMLARTAYWNLSLARDIVGFRQTSLDRTAKLLAWNEKRVKLDLADQGDLLEAKAGYQLRQLNLQLAREDEIKAGRDFNFYLGISSDAVDAAVEKLADKVSFYANVPELQRTGERADVLAAREQYESSKYADKETHYRSLPELTGTFQYALHGLDLGYWNAWHQVTGFNKPAYTLGLALIVPLDYKTLRTVQKGYKNDFYAAKEALDKTLLSSANDWDQLTVNWRNVKSRLSLAREIQTVQEQRVLNEQKKLARGRSTTFLVLTAENDLDDATLNVYRLVFEEFITAAQAELYNTAPQFAKK